MSAGNTTRRRDHGDGGIDARGDDRWRLRWRVGGKRFAKPFHGSISDARKELRRLIKSADDGEHVAPDKITIADYSTDWLASDTGISPKTRERYQSLLRLQITPHLGVLAVQSLRPDQVETWHKALLNGGLSARTVGHAHRVLHTGFERAVKYGVVARNVVHVVKPPRIDAVEIEILSPDQIAAVRAELAGHWLLPVVELALGTGMRRGELCALTWGAVDLAKGVVQVSASLEETAAGLRTKEPKTRHGRRSIALAGITAAALRDHYRQQVELRLKLGLGRPDPTDYVFPKPSSDTFSPWPPDQLSRDWARIVAGKRRGLPRVSFHALRHSHASMLIAAGVDILAISRRLGHGRPSVTLDVYGHLVERRENATVAALDAALGSS
jgi:integrase